MPVSKSQKKEVIDGLKTALSSAKSTVFVNFHKLTVADSTAMRKELSKNKITYTVAKKTLIKRALADANVSRSLPTLDGEIAIAYASDLTAWHEKSLPSKRSSKISSRLSEVCLRVSL